MPTIQEKSISQKTNFCKAYQKSSGKKPSINLMEIKIKEEI